MFLGFHRWAHTVLHLQDAWGRDIPLKMLLEYRTDKWWKEALPRYKPRENFRSKCTAGLRHGHAGKLYGFEAPLVLVYGVNWRELAQDKESWADTREYFVTQILMR